jgi:SPP1 family predicted phage head-tail adaptor
MNSIPRASDLKYKADVILPDDTSEDGYGSSPPAVIIAGMWVNVEDLSGLELVRAQMIADKATHRVTCRYDSRLNANQQLSFGDRTFRIAGLLDAATPGCGFNRNVWTYLVCVEIEAL